MTEALLPPICLLVGALLGAWIYSRGYRRQSPIPPVPLIPRSTISDGSDDDELVNTHRPKPRRILV